MSKFFDWLKRELSTKISILTSNIISGNLPLNKLLITTGNGMQITLIDNNILTWKFKGTNFTCELGEAYSIFVDQNQISMELPIEPTDGYVLMIKVRINQLYNETLQIFANNTTAQTIDGENDTLIVDYSTDLILVYDATNNNWRI
jgi:hypothetical protein